MAHAAGGDAPVKVIFDTDMVEDYDDVGAMACLHALADAGECEILAMATCTRDNQSVAAVEIINAFYGRPDIPVGCSKGIGVVGVPSGNPKRPGHQKYVRLAKEYADWVRHPNSNDAPDANEVYRRALAAAPDRSVVVISVGFLTNLRRLLETKGDAISPLDGKALVARKVKYWAAMACKSPKGSEYNSAGDAESSRIALAEWPTPIFVSDFDYGRNGYAGRAVAERTYAYRNPVKDIFVRCLPSRAATHDPKAWDKEEGGHCAWDETTVLAGVRPPERHYVVEHGRFVMTGKGGENVWVPDANAPGGRLADKVPKAEIGRLLDELIAREPKCRVQVNPFIGTGGNGHCFAAATYPFGLVQAGPDTGWGTWDYCSGYRYEDSHITMFSQTHNPGGGCPDYADIGIMPGVVSNAFSHTSETARPGYYAVTLKDGNIRVEVTASEHCALYRIGFGPRKEAKLLVDLDYGMSNETWAKKTVKPLAVDRSPKDGLTGHLLRSGFVKGRHIGFDIRFSKQPIGCAELPPVIREKNVKDRSPRLVYTFDLSDGEPLLVKCGISTVDGEGAGRNLRKEIPDWNFDAVRAAAEAKWREQLSRVELDPSTDRDVATIFSTSVYRLFHTPSNIADVDGRYRGGDDQVAVTPNGRYYSEFSLWDTFRGAHPFYTVVASEYIPDFVNSLVRHGEAVGFLPVLPKWGKDSQCMIATHAVSVIVEAYFKGFKGVDWERAYRAIRQTLRESHPTRHKEGWDLLDKYGYYPCDVLKGEGVSRTLECSYDDWCAARMAAALGHAEDAAFFAKRAENWRNVFDAKTGFMRGRKTDGSWREPFDPYHCGHEASWAGDFTEGNAWQWRWHVLQDPPALVAALGGKERAAALLDELFTLPSELDKSQTSFDVTGLEGQYVQGNEPSHHIPYLYQYAGRPDRAAERIRQLSRKFYRNAPDGLCGNEDHGEMSAWYVFACLGFYPVNPASGEFVLGAPQVPGATLRVPGGKTFRIVAKNLSEQNVRVKSVTLDGRPLDGFVLRYADIVKGGELVFEMTK